MSANQCIFVGYLGGDPEMSFLPTNGKAVAKFSIAVSERWTDKETNEEKEHTSWVRVNCFGKTAEIASQYLKKGSHILLNCKFVSERRDYADKPSEFFHYFTPNKGGITFLDSKPENAGNQGTQP
jgi:single-strand DNA-binding protein